MPRTKTFTVKAKTYKDDIACDACGRFQMTSEKPEDPHFYMKIDDYELIAIRCSCCGHTFFMTTLRGLGEKSQT